MPLQDHFHPPLSLRRHWHAFHNAWATFIAVELNRHLPKGYFAEPNVQFGIEIDVAAFEEEPGAKNSSPKQTNGWNPPAPTQTIPFAVVTDTVEIRVFRSEEGPVLAGAIELVSPGNKDRPEQREAFVSKCAAYLQQGIGLVIVDIVTDRSANLHLELARRVSPANIEPASSPLYASAYRPFQQDSETLLNIWFEPLAVGQPLPIMPLWLPGELCLRVDLETTYQRISEELRLPANGK